MSKELFEQNEEYGILPIVEDEYLTHNSEEFHRHMGFETVGEFHRCIYKFGRWYNMIWMEKMIGEHR